MKDHKKSTVVKVVTSLCFLLILNVSSAQVASHSIALAHNKEYKWHYINDEGKFLFKAQDEIYEFSEGLLTRFQKNNWGYVNCNGVWEIEPKFDLAKDFKNGYARVKTGQGWAFIDKKGNSITTQPLEGAIDFSEGLAGVKINGSWGFIDTLGALVIEPKFERVFPFSNGKAVVVKRGKWYLINRKGGISVTPATNPTYMGSYSNNFARVRTGGYDKTIYWGYIDSTGAKAIPSLYKNAEDFSEGVARVRAVNKWGYINVKGVYQINPLFDDAEDFKDGYARVKFKGKWGLIDLQGKWIIPAKYETLWEFSDGLAPAESKGNWGLIDMNENWKVAPNYDYIKRLKVVNCK